MDVPSPITDSSQGPPLDEAPVAPPGAKKRMPKSMMDVADPKLGADAANPQIIAVKGLQFFERGVEMISQVLPALGPQLGNVLTQLRQLVPQALAGGGGLQSPGTTAIGGMPPPGPPMPTPGPPQGAMPPGAPGPQ